MDALQWHPVQCPCCWETIELVIDTSCGEQQQYVEDCSVCCRPLLITVSLSDENGMQVTVEEE